MNSTYLNTYNEDFADPLQTEDFIQENTLNFSHWLEDINQSKINRNIQHLEQNNTTINLKLPNILDHKITKNFQDKQNNDKATMDSFGHINKNSFENNFSTSEEFLKYLDTCFKPEINLEEDNESHKILFSQEKNVEPKSEVKLSYRGQKNTFNKGKNAERRDVLYKTFARTIRRYMSDIFEKEFDGLNKIKKTDSKKFKQKVEEFYNKYFRECAKSLMNCSEVDQENLCFMLSVLITNKVSFPHKSDEMKKKVFLFRSMSKSFCSTSYI